MLSIHQWRLSPSVISYTHNIWSTLPTYAELKTLLSRRRCYSQSQARNIAGTHGQKLLICMLVVSIDQKKLVQWKTEDDGVGLATVQPVSVMTPFVLGGQDNPGVVYSVVWRGVLTDFLPFIGCSFEEIFDNFDNSR